jgi:ATP-binding cassette subfamily B multidrug efflux pump
MRLVTASRSSTRPVAWADPGTAGMTLWLWMQGEVGVGAVAAATAMALRLNGISHWVMWEMATLFEHIGTVQDGIARCRARTRWSTRPMPSRCDVPRGEIRFERCGFATAAAKVIDGSGLTIRPGEKIGLVGPLGRRQEHGGQPAAALLRPGAPGPHPDRRQDIAGVTQDSLRARSAWSRRTPRCCTARCATTSSTAARTPATPRCAAAERAEAHDFIVGLTDPKGRKATTPTSASAASSSRAASASASRSPA